MCIFKSVCTGVSRLILRQSHSDSDENILQSKPVLRDKAKLEQAMFPSLKDWIVGLEHIQKLPKLIRSEMTEIIARTTARAKRVDASPFRLHLKGPHEHNFRLRVL